MVPETCWASNKICNNNHLLHLVGILFPHITFIYSTSFYASLLHIRIPQTPVSLRRLFKQSLFTENYNKHIAICVKNAKLITLRHVVHVVTIVLHTDEDKETSALLIFHSCNVTYSIQFRRELAAMHYVTLLGTAGEMRSNGYLIPVHSFQRPTLYYDWRKTLDDVTNCNFQHPDMWGRISLLTGWLEKGSVVKIYIPWKVTRSWPFRDIGPYGHTGHLTSTSHTWYAINPCVAKRATCII